MHENATLVFQNSIGEPLRAIQFYEEALAILRESDDQQGEGDILWNMSLTLDELGQRAQAIVRAQDALEIYEQLRDTGAESVRKQLVEWREEQ